VENTYCVSAINPGNFYNERARIGGDLEQLFLSEKKILKLKTEKVPNERG
jgi:hypothetical protein